MTQRNIITPGDRLARSPGDRTEQAVGDRLAIDADGLERKGVTFYPTDLAGATAFWNLRKTAETDGSPVDAVADEVDGFDVSAPTTSNEPTKRIGGTPGAYAQFDGMDDYLETAQNGPVDFFHQEGGSVIATVQDDVSASDGVVVGNVRQPGNNPGFEVREQGADLRFLVSDGTSLIIDEVTTSNIFADAGWHHVAISYGPTFIRVWIDKVLTIDKTISVTLSSGASGVPLAFGASQDSGVGVGVFWDGGIADVLFATETLTQSAVDAHYAWSLG